MCIKWWKEGESGQSEQSEWRQCLMSHGKHCSAPLYRKTKMTEEGTKRLIEREWEMLSHSPATQSCRILLIHMHIVEIASANLHISYTRIAELHYWYTHAELRYSPYLNLWAISLTQIYDQDIQLPEWYFPPAMMAVYNIKILRVPSFLFVGMQCQRRLRYFHSEYTNCICRRRKYLARFHWYALCTLYRIVEMRRKIQWGIALCVYTQIFVCRRGRVVLY